MLQSVNSFLCAVMNAVKSCMELNKMRAVKKLKMSLKQSKAVLHGINEASKIRFAATDIEMKIKCGVPDLKQKGLFEKDAYLNLSLEGQLHAVAIVDEECERKSLWKGKELPKLARIIERRLKAECQ